MTRKSRQLLRMQSWRRTDFQYRDCGPELFEGFFIEQSHDNFDAIKQIIDRNVRAKGWLIFATHDVCDQPTRFGCSPGFFEKVVDYAIQSKATILPVFRAWQVIFGTTDERSPKAGNIQRTLKLDIPRFAKGGPAAP